jgi:hypothetical protein
MVCGSVFARERRVGEKVYRSGELIFQLNFSSLASALSQIIRLLRKMMQERKHYTLEEKRQYVAAWRASGLTRQQYNELHDIKFSTFREWP